jgi:hypothetical protein
LTLLLPATIDPGSENSGIGFMNQDRACPTVTGLQHPCGEIIRAAKYSQQQRQNWFIGVTGFADGRFPRILLAQGNARRSG